MLFWWIVFLKKTIFFYQDSIQSGEDPKNSVKLQENVSFEDWLAVHVVDFMNRVQLFYSLVDENCTEDSCPKMSGGQKYEYLWQDGIKYKVFCKNKNQIILIKFLQNWWMKASRQKLFLHFLPNFLWFFNVPQQFPLAKF